MIQRVVNVPPDLYKADETAWLEAMSELIQQGRFGDLDYPHLREYLADMERRDRREVKSRLVVLIKHVLKWMHQAEKRSASWRGTIIAQRQELADLLASGTLRNHAEAVLAETYENAVERAVAETELPAETFSEECPYTLDQLLSEEVVT
jgi:Domain of unknown function DUF29